MPGAQLLDMVLKTACAPSVVRASVLDKCVAQNLTVAQLASRRRCSGGCRGTVATGSCGGSCGRGSSVTCMHTLHLRTTPRDLGQCWQTGLPESHSISVFSLRSALGCTRRGSSRGCGCCSAALSSSSGGCCGHGGSILSGSGCGGCCGCCRTFLICRHKRDMSPLRIISCTVHMPSVHRASSLNT